MGESSAPECYHGITLERVLLERFCEFAKRIGFGEAEAGLASVPKNLGNGLALARLNSDIQIHKIPIHVASEFLPHAALAASHESDQKDRAYTHGFCGTTGVKLSLVATAFPVSAGLSPATTHSPLAATDSLSLLYI